MLLMLLKRPRMPHLPPHRGSTGDNMLTMMDDPGPDEKRENVELAATEPQDARAPIEKLPIELFLYILELATILRVPLYSDCPCNWKFKYLEPKASLSRVSRTFNYTVKPLLYRDLFAKSFQYPDIHPSEWKDERLAASLYRILGRDPSLGQHCRTLRVCFQGKSYGPHWFRNDMIAIPNDIISWLPRLRCIAIHCRLGRDAQELVWAFARNVQIAIPSLKELIYRPEHYEIPANEVCRNFRYNNLEALKLFGLCARSAADEALFDPEVSSKGI